VDWLLFYEVVDDYLERRGEWRDAHLAKAREAEARGELLLAGALAEPADGAVLVFKAESSHPAERFASEDPYMTAGLVTRWQVRRWQVVVGADSDRPA
jgi:uncharacterized protein